MKLAFLRMSWAVGHCISESIGFFSAVNLATSQYDQGTTNVGGQTARPGVASAFFQQSGWIAYLNSNTCSGNLCNVVVKQNYNYGTAWSNEQYVWSAGTGTNVTSNANPTLAVLNGLLYMAYTDAQNKTGSLPLIRYQLDSSIPDWHLGTAHGTRLLWL